MAAHRLIGKFLADPLLFGFFLLLLWVPLPKASNRIGALFFLELAVFVLLLLWCWQFWRGKRSLPSAIKLARPMWFGWGLLVALLVLQIVPLPSEWLLWLSPHSFSVYQLAYQDAELPAWLSLSVDRYATLLSLQKTLAYLGLFTLTLLLVRERHHFRWLAYTLVISAVVQAAYGTLMVVTGWEYGFLSPKTSYLKLATGTFVNRNHFANYLALCACVGIALMLIRSSEGVVDRSQQQFRRLIDWVMSDKIRLRFGLVVIAIGLVMSRSRMGNTAFFMSLTLVGVLCLMLSRERSRPLLFLVGSILVLDMAIVGSFVGMDQVVSRIENTTATTEHRDEVAEDSVVYWQDFYWLGSGGGSYYATYPRYKDDTVGGYYDHAHNDYLEIATEFGAVGLFVFGYVVFLTLLHCLAVYRRSRDRYVQGICFAVLMAISVLLIHSTVDFSLQIPANASLICVVLALGWVAFNWHQRTKKTVSRGYYGGAVTQKMGLVALSLTLAGLVAWVSCWAIAHDITGRNEYRVTQWKAAGAVPEADDWLEAVTSQQWAWSMVPTSPSATLILGRVLQWREQFEEHSLGLKKQPDAEDLFIAAARHNPGDVRGWLVIVVREVGQHRFGPVFSHAIATVITLAPWERAIHDYALDLVLPNWYRLTEETKGQLVGFIDNAFAINPGKTRQQIKKHQRQNVVCVRSAVLAQDKLCGGYSVVR